MIDLLTKIGMFTLCSWPASFNFELDARMNGTFSVCSTMLPSCSSCVTATTKKAEQKFSSTGGEPMLNSIVRLSGSVSVHCCRGFTASPAFFALKSDTDDVTGDRRNFPTSISDLDTTPLEGEVRMVSGWSTIVAARVIKHSLTRLTSTSSFKLLLCLPSFEGYATSVLNTFS